MKIPGKLSIILNLALLLFSVWAMADEPPIDTVLDSTKSDDDKWDVTVPHVPSDTVRFEATEGTWISVDVHPDGSRIIFDLLGDLYEIPITGGDAKLISGGLQYDVQPRYSPDGSRILFTSDRDGGDNIWVAGADGSDPLAVSSETFRLLNNGYWHPDGNYIVARKHFTSDRSLGAGEMWLFRADEGGSGVGLTKRKNQQQDAGEPIFSPDGNYLYWSEDMSGGDYFQYNKDPNGTIYMIRRLDLTTGEVQNLIRLDGGACRPQISPDGKTMAFVRRVRGKSVLSLYDLESGTVRQLWDRLDKDQQETWAIFGVYPGFDWTPDGSRIIITAKGKIWSIKVADGEATQIPFKCQVEQIVAKALRFPVEVGRSEFPTKVIRWPSITPDNQRVIYQSLGYLYQYDIKSGSHSRLTRQTNEYEFAPAISHDGQSIVYVTWNDREGGRVKTMRSSGKSVKEIVSKPGHYRTASFSPDGNRIVYHRGGSDGFRGVIWDEDTGIYLIDAEGKTEPTFLTREGTQPRFSADGQRIYLNSREDEQAALISINLLGSDRRVHAVSERAFDFEISPDENWIAFEELWQTYVTPFTKTADPLSLAPEMKNLPVRKLSKNGGTYLGWSNDSKTIRWSLGPELAYTLVEPLFEPTDEDDDVEAGADEDKNADEDKEDKKDAPEFEPDLIDLSRTVVSDIPATDLYFTNAKILPMNDLSLIESGTIHIKNNLIEEIGPADQITIPAGSNVIDLEGKTVAPGFVDVHAHVWSSNGGIYPQQNWSLLANLAFGVTTVHDPSNNTQMIFAAAEMVESGQLLGPRIYSTGTILYGAEGDFKTVIDDYDDALEAVRRTAAWGAISVKSYNQPRRNQRQMVIKAGLEEKIMVVPEGGSTLFHNINMILDGHTTIEHALPVAPIYDPLLRLLSESGTGYTPTFVVAYGGQSGERYWYQHTNVWENKRLNQFVPRSSIDSRSIRRPMAPDSEYHHFEIARTAAEIVRRGGNIQIGSHGQMQGLAAHWEIWIITQGGLSNHEALRAATYMGAKAIGMDHKIGSLQKGMLADLVVFGDDPLADIRQSENIELVMVNGRLYDAMTLDQQQPTVKPLPDGPFTDEVTRSHISHQGCLSHNH